MICNSRLRWSSSTLPYSAINCPALHLSDGQWKNRHFPRAEQPGVAHFADDGGHLAGPQFGNSPGIQPVFIAKRQIMEQVADGVNSLRSQHFPDARTNAL